jgi:hypothetical protein
MDAVMSRPTLPLAALLLTVLAAASAHAVEPHPEAPAQEIADTPFSAYQQRWESALMMAGSGNMLGAMIAFERLMDDPLFARLEPAVRGRNAQIAGATALMQHAPGVARRYLQQALTALPNDPATLATLVSVELAEDNTAAATLHLLQAATHADGPVQVDTQTVSYLQYTLRAQPAQRMALLKSLFDNQWTGDGVEPTGLWLVLATLQVEHGHSAEAAATIARIDTPLEVIALRSDKRFDRYVDRRDPRFDPQQVAQRKLDDLRVSGLLDRRLNAKLAAFGFIQLMVGENEQIVQFTDDMARMVSAGQRPAGEEATWLAWLLDYRTLALRRLDRIDDSVAAARLTDAVGALGPDAAEHRMNLAFMLSATGHERESDTLLAGMDGLSPFGLAARAYLTFVHARENNDPAAAAAARAEIVSHRKDAPQIHMELLIEEGDMEAAAAALISQLESAEDRTDALLSLQDMRVYPSLPAERVADERWRELKQRADVRAAINRVGRIERYPLYSISTSR